MQSLINKSPTNAVLSVRGLPAASCSAPSLRAGVAALIGALFGVPAFADTLQPFVSASISHEDNLFRLSDDQKRVEESAETYRNVTGGLLFTRPIGRQTISGGASFTSVKYDRFEQLDYLGKNLNGEWHWFFTNRFEGHIGGSYAQTSAPFSDFHSHQRNLLVTRKEYADGSWRFHPSWQWRAGYTNERYAYEQLSERDNDRSEDAITTGIDYLASSGSIVGFQLRRLEGKYPHAQAAGPGLFGNDYTQDEAKVNITWLASGHTQVLFLGGWARRRQDARAGTADSGTNARLIVNWTPTARIRLGGQAWREFSAIEGALIDSALNTGSLAQATWSVTEKIEAIASLKHETRKFAPTSAARASLPSANFSDSSTTANMGVSYKPLRKLTLKLVAFRDQRSGSVAAGTNSFKANGASFSVSQQF